MTSRIRGFVLHSCLSLSLAGLSLAGCDSDPDPGTDAGPTGTDAGPTGTDAGPTGTDAGPTGTDAGPTGTDAGPTGTDAGPTGTDAGPTGTDAGPAASGHCGATDLIIEAVDPGTSITVFNPTAGAIDTSGYIFCERPTYPSLGSIEAGVTIAPGASHAFAWPSGFSSTDAGGEVAFYVRGGFSSPENQIDFVCWGTGASASRKSVAEMDGDWVGACSGAITGDSLRRVPSSDGSAAADYDPTGAAAALTCP